MILNGILDSQFKNHGTGIVEGFILLVQAKDTEVFCLDHSSGRRP